MRGEMRLRGVQRPSTRPANSLIPRVHDAIGNDPPTAKTRDKRPAEVARIHRLK